MVETSTWNIKAAGVHPDNCGANVRIKAETSALATSEYAGELEQADELEQAGGTYEIGSVRSSASEV
jgi:hypothetical protein